MRKIPSASSTFSDSRARKSSADIDSVIAGSAATTDGAHRRAFEELLDAERRRRADVLLPIRAGDRDLAIEQELHGVNRRAAFIQRAARLVTNLPAQPRQPEQLVDVREIKQRDVAEAIGELHCRQRFLP